MNFNADNIIDRIILKKSIFRWRVISILMLAALLIILFTNSDSDISAISKPYIARANLEGMIAVDKDRDQILDGILKDHNIKAMIININSSGGSAVGGEILYTKLKKFNENKKPIVAVLQDVAASGGYMAALGTDYIIAHHGTITGSIGVVMPSFEASELISKIGIKPKIYRSAPNKFSPNYFEPHTEESAQILNNMIADNLEFFKNITAERRNIEKEKIDKIADGRIYSAQQALDLNLIDFIGTEEDAIKWINNQEVITNKNMPIKDVKLYKNNLLTQFNEGTRAFINQIKSLSVF